MVFFYSDAATSPLACFSGVAVLSFLEIAGTAFVGFLYLAILATAVTRKTRGRPPQPAHPEASVPDFDRAA